jgi:DNA polymerase I-like protein with 3'-5' exonuclease and polymerase domains
MSGADGLNYHGIDGSRDIREIFTLADQHDWVVSGGDMQSQELAITAAVMKDTALGEVLEGGQKLHAIFAAEANGVPYEQIMKYADDKTRPESKWYAQGKVTSYSILYGASSFKVAMDLGCTVDEADKKIQAFFAKFPGMSETRKAVKRSLDCLGTDENGRLSAFKPQQDYVESVFGFRRSFQTELAVMDDMLEVMRAIPKSAGFDEKVVRTEKKGEQTVAGATSSALYAAVFSLQGKVFRAACNHLIQSSGRTCTLRVQHRIWNDLQPQGINPYRVKMMSVHDEIITTCHRNDAQAVQDCVASEMKALTRTIPLLSLDWAIDVGSWYGAKTCDGTRTGWGS